MFPDQFIGISVGRVGRKIEQPQPAVQALDKCFGLLGDMGRASIDDQENRALGTGDEALEKFDENIGVDAASVLDHEPHLAARGDCRDEAHAMARARRFHDRRFALLAPAAPRVMIRAHVGGIAKENLRFFPLRQRLDPRIFLLEPLLDQSLVALLRTIQRLLAGDAVAPTRPTELALNTTPNLSLISLPTMSRVHSANANFSCKGFFSVTVL